MIEIRSSKKGFVLLFKGQPVIDHSSSEPCLVLGTAQGDYRMSHGSFFIKEKVGEKSAQKKFEIKKNSTESASVTFDLCTMNFTVKDDRLSITFEGIDKKWNRITVNFAADSGEHIYGCGEQYSVLDMKGLKTPIWVEEQGVGRGHDAITLLANLHSDAGGKWYTTYFSQPTYLSNRNYFIHAETTAWSSFDFRKGSRSTLYFWETPKEIIFDKCATALRAMNSLSSYLGRQPALPEWTYDGIWLGVQGGTELVDRKLRDAQKAGVKVGALWAQDWEGRRITAFGKQLMWNWKYSQELYADLPSYIKKLNKEGVRFLGYINPYLAIGTTDSEDAPIPDDFFYKEAKAKGYCTKKKDGKDYYIKVTTFPAGVMDFTNPDAREWYKNIIKDHMIGIGLSGWMADFGESLPVDSVLKSGENGEIVHNTYPVQWAKVNYEAVKESGKLGELCWFMRSGYTGSQKYASSIWAGDQLVNWSFDDGLATVIPAGISMGISGIGYHHSDIGGYTTLVWIKRSKELFMRWAEHCAFTQTMRSHEGNRPDVNAQFWDDAETLSHLAKMTKVFTAMKPYHIALSKEYQEKGVAPIRHPYMHYEKDETVHKLTYQYMYGPDLLVAPVIKPGKKSWKVYLPDDRWIHAWSGREYKKGWHRIASPLGEPPVFYRAASSFADIFKGFKDVK